MLCALGGLLSAEGTIRNCARWSDIEKVKLPEVQFSNSGLFEYMLSIRVWDRLVIQVFSVIISVGLQQVNVEIPC